MTTAAKSDVFPPVFYVVIAVFIWSTGGLFIKLTTLDAYQVTFFRSLLAGLTVAIVTRNQGLRINGFGILTSIIYATLLFLFVWATKKTTAANAIFLQYTAPIYILILAPFVIGEKFHWRDLVTVVFCIAGMSLFFVGKLEISDYQGNIAALFSGVFLGLYIMLLRHPRALGRRQEAEGSDMVSEAHLPTSAADVTGESSTSSAAKSSPPFERVDADRARSSPPLERGDAERAKSSPPFERVDADRARSSPPSDGGDADAAKSSPPSEGGDAERSEAGVVLPSRIDAEPVGNNPQSMNPAIAVIYGNFLLAILCLGSGISAVPVMTSLDWFAVSFLGIVQIGIAYILFIKGVTGGTRPLDASIIGFIEPLLNPVWVFLFLGEQPSRWAILGGAIIITTVLIHTVIQYRIRPATA